MQDKIREAIALYDRANTQAELLAAGSELAASVRNVALGGEVPDHAMPLTVAGSRVRAAMPCQDGPGSPFRHWLVIIDQAPADVDAGTLAKFGVGYARWAPLKGEWQHDEKARNKERVVWPVALMWFTVWAADNVPSQPEQS